MLLNAGFPLQSELQRRAVRTGAGPGAGVSPPRRSCHSPEDRPSSGRNPGLNPRLPRQSLLRVRTNKPLEKSFRESTRKDRGTEHSG